MRPLVLAIVVSLAGCNLGGCSQLMRAFNVTPSDLAPSLKYCGKVAYERIETAIRIQAECTAPVGSM